MSRGSFSPGASIASDLGGGASPTFFLQQYFRAGRDLTATYNFLNGHTIGNQKNYRNTLLIDLNAGPHPNALPPLWGT